MNNNFLLDDQFLEELNSESQREIWVKITALTINEEPVEEIVGRTTTGSISIDGKSKMRRSCSLSMISSQMDINEYLWCLKTKVKVAVGMKNTVNKKYDDIVWFPQGIFILTSFSISVNNNQASISLQGKDKMCLLNGDVAGNLTALTYIFDTVEEENGYNSYYEKKLPLRYIIREAVHTYANEPYHNIIINDLDDWGLELLTYRGETPLYLIFDEETQNINNLTVNGEQEYYYNDNEYTINELEKIPGFSFKILNDFVHQGSNTGSIVTNEHGKQFRIIKIDYGMTCGYRITDLVYAQDLTLNVGDSLTSMLDKLVSMLGNFEYFYNLNGQFVFQAKPTYIQTSWNPLQNNGEEQWVDSSAYTSSHVYSLYNSKLISSFSNSPALNNVKNDFAIWGTQKGVTGKELPIHMRYAIDKKPEYYKNMKGQVFVTDESVFEKLKEEAKNSILNLVYDRIQNFQLTRSIPDGLTTPIKQTDGSWSAGWWDIRDWRDYYYALTLTEPRYTMKWYSRNNPEGCVPINSLPINQNGSYKNSYAWLIIKTSNGTYNFAHGSGIPDPNVMKTCYQHISYYDENTKKVITKQVIGDDGNPVSGKFMYPYATCTDSHTYLKFLKEDVEKNKSTVYFYNPAFPKYDSYEDLVNDQINKEYKEYLESGMLNFVDWREIIYQMAKDHNRYGNMDNDNIKAQLVKAEDISTGVDVVLPKDEYEKMADKYINAKDITLTTAIRLQNPAFYPSGYTGYEQYYIDMLEFWRKLYNPEYICTYKIKNLSKIEFEAIQNPDTIFYDAPVYTQCSAKTIYYDSITYYIKMADESYQPSFVTEVEFNRNKSSYYYISAVQKKPIPIKTQTIDPEATYYKTDNHTQTASGQEIIDNHWEKDYSSMSETVKKVQVFTQETYYPAHQYNIYNAEYGRYEALTQGITQSDYQGRPWVYYRAKNGKQTCCTSIAIPDVAGRPLDCWFEDESQTRTLESYSPNSNSKFIVPWDDELYGERIVLDHSVSNETLTYLSLNATISDDTFRYQKENMPWYYCYKIYTYEPLIRPAIEYDPQGTYYYESDIKEFNSSEDEMPYWSSSLISDPETLIFWFDFLDTDGELSAYSVPRIGDRPKAVNDKDVKAIYFRETPGIIFLEPEDWAWYTTGNNALEKPTGYAYAQMPSYFQHLFTISSQGKSAKDVLDEYLYQYSHCTESINVSALPIYHLEPNTRILIQNDNSHINGEYIIEKLSIPLDPKGMMTINAVKAVDRIY